MDFRKLLWAILAFTIALNVTSCKKDEEEDYLSFKGDLNFTLPPYVEVGDEFTLVPQGLKVYDEDITYGYYWRVTPTHEALDTTKRETDPRTVKGEFHYVIPDTLCTLKFALTVFGTGYYTTSVFNYATVLDKDRSITGQDFDKASGVFTDSRDGKSYHYVSIDGLDWFCENLSYNGYGVPLEMCDITGEVFGRYYNWEDAEKACPEGWRLPTEEEWIKLAQHYIPNGSFNALGNFSGMAGHLMSNAVLNGEKESLWEYWPTVNVTNEDCLNFLPFGFCISDGEYHGFDGFGEYASFWTGTKYDETQAVYRYIFEGKPDVFVGVADRESFYATVRCVRDSQ